MSPAQVVVALEALQSDDGTGPETVLMRLDSTRSGFADGAVFRTFACRPADLPQWSCPASVQRYGDALRTKLLAHPGIARACEEALAAPAAERPSIYFYIRTAQAEPFYWETLCDAQGKFWALDHGLPVGRMVPVCPFAGNRTFAPPLRVLAVLSALGLPAAEEWRGLWTAVSDVRRLGMPIELSVLVSEMELYHSLQALGGEEVSVTLLAADPLQVQHAIADFRPNLLHFFCHGTAGHGAPHLQLATPADWETSCLTQATSGSVSFAFSQLERLLTVKDLWLVTLNCCEGGKATGDVHSLAYSLVADAGVPAAIGMMEPVAAADAHAFCSGLYGALLRYLQDSLAGGGVAEIDWAQALSDPRLMLAQNNQPPAEKRQWALPVLYTARDSFQVQPVSERDPARLEQLTSGLAVLRGLSKALPPESTPEAVRKALQALEDEYRRACQPTAAAAAAPPPPGDAAAAATPKPPPLPSAAQDG